MSPSKIFSNILAHFSLQIFCSFLKLIILVPSTIWTYSSLILTHLKCAFDILLYNQYTFSSQTGHDELIRVTRFEHDNMSGPSGHCTVCLGEVEEGEEIIELRCSHVFHNLCLERWIRFKHTTCPLCRGSLAPPLSATAAVAATVEADFGVEVLFFKFCSFRSNDDGRDSWWLR